jgi:hypothetical protein
MTIKTRYRFTLARGYRPEQSIAMLLHQQMRKGRADAI